MSKLQGDDKGELATSAQPRLRQSPFKKALEKSINLCYKFYECVNLGESNHHKSASECSVYNTIIKDGTMLILVITGGDVSTQTSLSVELVLGP